MTNHSLSLVLASFSAPRRRRVVAAVFLLASGASSANGQQTCRPATPATLEDADYFLAEANVWLQAHGVTATSASQLPVLQLPGDSALCSVFATPSGTHPFTVFRVGRYLLPLIIPDSVPFTGVHINEARVVVLRDSTGLQLYYTGMLVAGNGPGVVTRNGWTFTASSTGGGTSFSALVDNNRATRWTTGASVSPGMTFLQVNLGTSQPVSAIRLDATAFTSDMPRSGAVYLSTDSVNYKLMARWASDDIDNGAVILFWSQTTARFVKIVATNTPASNSSWFSLGEVDVYQNYAEPLWSATASSQGGGPASAGIDGSSTSRWATGSVVIPDTSFYQVDTHTIRPLGGLRLDDSHFTGDIPNSGKVLLSGDGVTYHQVARWTSTDIASGVLVVTWSPEAARFVKLVATTTPSVSTNWFSIGELSLYPVAPPPM
ncbi:MAG: discoidin domain-containing protein [bacterium]